MQAPARKALVKIQARCDSLNEMRDATTLPASETNAGSNSESAFEYSSLCSGQRDCLKNSFGKVFACSRECPGDEAQGMSHGFVAIQIQLRITCVPTAVESQMRLSVCVPTAVGSLMRFHIVVGSRTRLSVCVPTAVESQTGSRRSY